MYGVSEYAGAIFRLEGVDVAATDPVALDEVAAVEFLGGGGIGFSVVGFDVFLGCFGGGEEVLLAGEFETQQRY